MAVVGCRCRTKTQFKPLRANFGKHFRVIRGQRSRLLRSVARDEKRQRMISERLLWLVATLITIFLGVVATAFFAR